MKCIKVFCIVVVSLFIDNVFCMNANISEKINASINSVGDALIHNTKNTIYSIKDSQLEAVLYLTKDESQKYKEIIRQIENNDVIESVVHDTVGNKDGSYNSEYVNQIINNYFVFTPSQDDWNTIRCKITSVYDAAHMPKPNICFDDYKDVGAFNRDVLYKNWSSNIRQSLHFLLHDASSGSEFLFANIIAKMQCRIDKFQRFIDCINSVDIINKYIRYRTKGVKINDTDYYDKIIGQVANGDAEIVDNNNCDDFYSVLCIDNGNIQLIKNITQKFINIFTKIYVIKANTSAMVPIFTHEYNCIDVCIILINGQNENLLYFGQHTKYSGYIGRLISHLFSSECISIVSNQNNLNATVCHEFIHKFHRLNGIHYSTSNCDTLLYFIEKFLMEKLGDDSKSWYNGLRWSDNEEVATILGLYLFSTNKSNFNFFVSNFYENIMNSFYNGGLFRMFHNTAEPGPKKFKLGISKSIIEVGKKLKMYIGNGGNITAKTQKESVGM